MTSITTAFTQKFGLTHPFAQAGMAFAGEKPELAIAVGKAGGIGAIGVGFMPPEELRATIRTIRAAGVTMLNINFITVFGNDAQVQVAAEENVCATKTSPHRQTPRNSRACKRACKSTASE